MLIIKLNKSGNLFYIYDMNNLIKILFLSFFWFSCEDSSESEGESVVLWETSYSIENTFELDLTSNELTGEIPAEIGELINLEKLDLKSNSLSGNIPSSLANLQNLIELNLYNNMLLSTLDTLINTEIVDNTETLDTLIIKNAFIAITDLTNLNYLTLETNMFEGPIPIEITKLSNLIGLDLRNNMFSDTIPGSIGDELLNLEFLYLHDNDFSGVIDPRICNLNIDFSSEEYFNISNNKFCPPYPPCIPQEQIDSQNTSNCP